MSAFKASLQRASNKASIGSVKNNSSIRNTVRQHLAVRAKNRDLPTVPKCPAPTCECADMPSDLDIDMERKLDGTMAAYSEHLIINTGQADWKSRIEDEKDSGPWGQVVSTTKSLLGPKGRLHDPYRNVVVSTSSFAVEPDQPPGALVFPSFSYISHVPTSESDVATFLESHVLSGQQQEAGQQGSKKSVVELVKERAMRSGSVTPITAPTILVCSHNSRDSRCGILGPLLHQEFSQYINKRHSLRNKIMSEAVDDFGDHAESSTQSFASHPEFRSGAIDGEHENQQPINVGMISHIGGHKWAGNIIIYIPPGYQANPVKRDHRGARPQDQAANEAVVHEDERLPKATSAPLVSPLAGKGIWYGRVRPEHVEGIVEQTIGQGNIIKELFRGGINQNGSPIRL